MSPEWKYVGTTEQPLHIKMPDGAWRTFQGNAGTPLKQKQSDGTWKNVAWTERIKKSLFWWTGDSVPYSPGQGVPPMMFDSPATDVKTSQGYQFTSKEGYKFGGLGYDTVPSNYTGYDNDVAYVESTLLNGHKGTYYPRVNLVKGGRPPAYYGANFGSDPWNWPPAPSITTEGFVLFAVIGFDTFTNSPGPSRAGYNQPGSFFLEISWFWLFNEDERGIIGLSGTPGNFISSGGSNVQPGFDAHIESYDKADGTGYRETFNEYEGSYPSGAFILELRAKGSIVELRINGQLKTASEVYAKGYDENNEEIEGIGNDVGFFNNMSYLELEGLYYEINLQPWLSDTELANMRSYYTTKFGLPTV